LVTSQPGYRIWRLDPARPDGAQPGGARPMGGAKQHGVAGLHGIAESVWGLVANTSEHQTQLVGCVGARFGHVASCDGHIFGVGLCK